MADKFKIIDEYDSQIYILKEIYQYFYAKIIIASCNQ